MQDNDARIRNIYSHELRDEHNVSTITHVGSQRPLTYQAEKLSYKTDGRINNDEKRKNRYKREPIGL